ncbi:helix-turn-helix transcriptional regulator [Alkaliphilus pronyensis]|uniref:Helix-turn-helix transcriptional regulator n=1 Tax=Alkaliphilus pronyensis TaxID=1482732 RepID=A0A6I0EY91_9FIRM|nr:helix-turn-helix transcriptional regulator [Alkaliphilus pronyensis]KAB3534410.1 helix-turn-helix transcriptional regulator [Alkaliphilus pronyensis]
MGRPKLDVNPNIGKRLKLIRKNLKMTQLDFAERYNVSEQTIRNWENGRNTVPDAVLDDLSANLAIDMQFLKCKTDDPKYIESMKKFDSGIDTEQLTKDVAIHETFLKYLDLLEIDVSSCSPKEINQIEKETREFINFQISKLK